MVIGIDAREAAGPRPNQQVGAAGRARYVRELVTRLPAAAPDARFVLYANEDGALAGPSNVEWRAVRRSGVRWHLGVARKARTETDLYFSTMGYVTPHFLRAYVQTVFDLIAFKDFALPHRHSARVERLTLGRTLRHARAIVTISEATARDLRALGPEVAERVAVTPLAADARFHPNRTPEELDDVRRRYGLPTDYVLATGTIEPRKNLSRLVKAFAALPGDVRSTHMLVLVGKKGWDHEPVFEAIAAHAGGRAVHLDFVPDDDLARLYAGATVFCYPSLYEGFGLPVLEAMQAGAPVVTSHISSLPEVGGDAVRYVDPYDVGDIARTLADVLGDEAQRKALSRAGIERARRFSWETTARLTLDVLRAAA